MTGTVSNVVLVTVDSLRADAVTASADDRTTPEMGGLADEGIVFENAFAGGNWTPFSFPSIFASRPVFAETGDIGLPSTSSLPETLQAEGYRTGGFNAANGFLTAHWGYDRGFDSFESFIKGSDSSRYSRYLAAHPTVQAWLQLASSPFRRAANWIRRGEDDQPFTDTSRLLDVERHATEFIGQTDEPFFLWVHYMDTHTPYVPAPRHLREVSDGGFETHRILRAHVHTGLGWAVGDRTLSDLRTLYAGAARQVDASIGRLKSTLTEAGIADETALILAGDHGEEFMEHGHLAHYPKLYDELVHVPLIMSIPGEPSRRIKDPVGLDSIPPTVCDLLGVSRPPAWSGRSLVRSPDGEVSSEDDPVMSVAVRGERVSQQPIPRALSQGDLIVSARTAEWVYIENTSSRDRELYNRDQDPTQQRNLYETDQPVPDVADKLAAAVDSHVSSLGSGDDQREDVDSELETRLQALGYQ